MTVLAEQVAAQAARSPAASGDLGMSRPDDPVRANMTATGTASPKISAQAERVLLQLTTSEARS